MYYVFYVFQGISSPHDLAISQKGDAVYIVEVPLDRKNVKIHKYDVINNNNSPDQASLWADSSGFSTLIILYLTLYLLDQA